MSSAHSSAYAASHPFFRELDVPTYAGDALKLVEHGMQYAQNSLDWVRNEEVGQFMGADFSVVNTQTEIDRIREILGDTNEYNWVIVFDGKAIGAVAIKYIRELSEEYSCKAGNLAFLIGYPEFRGKGIASAVLRSVLAWAFNEAGFEVMTARALQENIASQKTLLRLGFEECGTEPYDGLVQGKPSLWKKYRLRNSAHHPPSSAVSKIIFLHGNGGEGAGHYWFPYAKRMFEQMGLAVVAKDFPDATLARRSIWLPFLEHECGADEHSILIGHSSGAIAAMRWAENHRIFGSVLVGAYHSDLGLESERVSGYFEGSWDWEAIRRNQNWIIQFASVDDPFFGIEEPRMVHEKLATEYHEFTNRGHFFEKEFPELIETVRKKLS